MRGGGVGEPADVRPGGQPRLGEPHPVRVVEQHPLFVAGPDGVGADAPRPLAMEEQPARLAAAQVLYQMRLNNQTHCRVEQGKVDTSAALVLWERLLGNMA